MDVFEMLAADHRTAENLFQRIRSGADAQEKRRLFAELERELDIHARLEEEIFYPALRHDGADPMLDEALAEHAGMQRQIGDMHGLDVDSEAWWNHLEELSRTVEHHVHEEETQMFPKAREVLSTRLQESLIERMHARKEQLQSEGGGGGEAAREAAARARDWASQGASEVARQAQTRGREFLEKQTRSAAAGARDVAEALRDTGQDLSQRGRTDLSEYIMQAADGLNRLSERLARGDMDGMLRQVSDTARRHPGAMFGGAIAAGFLMSRFLKSSGERAHEYGSASTQTAGGVTGSSGVSDTSDTIPPQPH